MPWACFVRGSRLLSKKKLELAYVLHAEGVLCTDPKSAGDARLCLKLLWPVVRGGAGLTSSS